MREALVLLMLAMLILPLLFAVRQIRRLPKEGSSGERDEDCSPHA